MGACSEDIMNASKRLFGLVEVRELLRKEIELVGGQTAWSRRAGVERTLLNQVIRGRRLPTAGIVRALGLEKLVLPSVTDVLNRLSEEVDGAGGQSEWARRTGLSQTHISQVLIGRRRPGPQIIRALKLERTIAYAERDTPQ
jgi:DNA-binding transcriptional regulator YdaS (Cro superfamily)